jgi:hypothetical protein
VMLSIGARYLSAKAIMSKVEFHRVTTSRGIKFGLSLWDSQWRRQAGRAIVVEWMMANESFRSYETVVRYIK